jgi:CspA family cold shock protein
MRTFLVIAASALLLAAIIAELSTRLWPGSTLALLILAALAMLFQGYLSLRYAAPAAATAAPRAARPSGKTERPKAKPADTRKTTSEAAPAADGPRESGTVKWFNRTKGFGFIVRESGEEIFVHQRSIRSDDGARRPSLKDGQAVTFTVANREKGLQAEDVTPA